MFSVAGFRRRQAAEKQEQLADILASYSSSGLPTPDDDDEDEEGEADEEDGEPEDRQSAEEECTSPRRRRRRRPGGSVFSLEPSWADVVRDAAALDKRQRDYQEAVWELLATELQHIDKLRVVVDVRHHTAHQCLFQTFPRGVGEVDSPAPPKNAWNKHRCGNFHADTQNFMLVV